MPVSLDGLAGGHAAFPDVAYLDESGQVVPASLDGLVGGHAAVPDVAYLDGGSTVMPASHDEIAGGPGDAPVHHQDHPPSSTIIIIYM